MIKNKIPSTTNPKISQQNKKSQLLYQTWYLMELNNVRIREDDDTDFLSKNSLTLQSLLQNSLGSCLLECYNCMINDLMFYRSLHYAGHMLGLVSLHDSFFTVPYFNCMYDQSAPHGVVEAFSFHFPFLIVSSRTSYVFLMVNRYI